MTKKTTQQDYSYPVCEILDISAEGILCSSGIPGSGTTEDMDELDELFRLNNW